jgi:hypothetical protein
VRINKIKEILMKKIVFGLFAIIAMCFMSTSCLFIKPYDKPEYVSIGTNETAFLIDQFADDKSENGQVKVNGDADYRFVNSKLVKIGHKWVKTGRMPGTGKYIAAEIVIAVSNSPVTGTWTHDIKVETRGSQGFTVPMKYGIRVKPENSEKFLRNFPANLQVKDENGKLLSKKMTSVENVADVQFKNQVAAELSKEFHKYEYKDVLPNRDVIVEAAVARVIEWANELGITIDNLAVFEGLIPDDTTLQDAMDEQAKLAAQVETEKQRQNAEKQKKQNEIELLALEKQRIQAETENAKAEARKTVETQQILAQTSNIELARKQREQEIANLKLRGEAEAEAIKIRAKALENVSLPKVITSNDLKVLGLDSLIREATDSSR